MGVEQINLFCGDMSTVSAEFWDGIREACDEEFGVGEWWFMRKSPGLRIRGTEGHSIASFDGFKSIQGVYDATASVYEPENVICGGTLGGELVRTGLSALAGEACAVAGRGGQENIVLGVMWANALLDGLGADASERCEFWGYIADQRRGAAYDGSSSGTLDKLLSARWVLEREEGDDVRIRALFGADRIGSGLLLLRDSGMLDAGMRAVAAWSVMFGWNMLGFSAKQQWRIGRKGAEINASRLGLAANPWDQVRG